MKWILPFGMLCLVLLNIKIAWAENPYILRTDSLLKLQFENAKTGGRLGLSVYSRKNQKFLHQWNQNDLFRPASTLKIYTTATALEHLDPDQYFITRFVLRGQKFGNTFWGRIDIYPRGDFGISGRFYPRALDALNPISQALKAQGIDTLWGEIRIADPYYLDAGRPSVWENKFIDKCYATEISDLVFDENCVDLKIESSAFSKQPLIFTEPYVGSFNWNNRSQYQDGRRNQIRFSLDDKTNQITVDGLLGKNAAPQSHRIPVRQPNEHFRSALKSSLHHNGINFQEEKIKDSLEIYREYSLKTRPLREMIYTINRRSQNLFSEMLIKNLGGEVKGVASTESGLRVQKEFLQKLNIAPDQYRIVDGSGLSYHNRIRPADMHKVLNYMLEHPHKETFINSLNFATELGASGSRMRDVFYAHGVRFKTGFVAETHGLSGYIFTATGDTLVVSMLLNDYNIADGQARTHMDTWWKFLVDSYDRERISLLEMEHIHASQISNLNHISRIDFFSTYFIGRPYFSPPTGEGNWGKASQAPMVQTSVFDCVTYMEHVLALAYFPQDSLFSGLQSIRYFGKPDFMTRNHFFVNDWMHNNSWMIRLDTSWNDTIATRTIDKKGFFNRQGYKYLNENKLDTLNFVSIENALKVFSRPWNGDDKVMGMALVGSVNWLWASHTGFLILKNAQKPRFRHASTRGQVIEEDLDIYLERLKSTRGLLFFNFVEREE
jgi:PBP4 family serine-type D-alanyl-D-alanine carboxypeptidase